MVSPTTPTIFAYLKILDGRSSKIFELSTQYTHIKYISSATGARTRHLNSFIPVDTDGAEKFTVISVKICDTEEGRVGILASNMPF